MSDRKFFTGLPDNMMKGSSGGPDRQQTHFYWPNETDTEEHFVTPSNRLRNSSVSTASLLSQSQASSDTEESRRRKLQLNKSKINFYDTGDGTDTESVYSRAADSRKQNKQDTLRSRIHFYDFVDTQDQRPDDDDVQSVIERPMKKSSEPSGVEREHVINVTMDKSDEKMRNDPQNFVNESLTQSVQNLNMNSASKNGYVPSSYIPPESSRKKNPQYAADSFSESDDEDRYYRTRNHVMEERKYLPPRYPPSQRSVRSHPRRYNSEYFDFDDDGYDRQYDSASRRLKYRKPENMPRMVRRREYSPEVSDEDFYDNVDGYRREREYSRSRIPPPERFRSNGSSRVDDNESYYRGRNNNRRPMGNGYASEMDFQSPPARKPSPQTNNNHLEEAPANDYASEMEPRMPTAARPPIKPLARTMSINEAKHRYHVNLKSNIFHNDPEYNVLVEQKKPLSVRDFAARQRVGVGLPDMS